MWPKFYRDYAVDQPLKKQCVEPGKGLNGGCEMHELNGWGLTLHNRPETPSSNNGPIGDSDDTKR